MSPYSFFNNQDIINKRKYDALREFFFLKVAAQEVAIKYGYTLSSFYSLSRDFRKELNKNPSAVFFFKDPIVGRAKKSIPKLDDMIIDLRKNNYSTLDIVGLANSKGYKVTYGYVYNLLKSEGFAKLHRRSVQEKTELNIPKIIAPKSVELDFTPDRFHSNATGLFVFLPLISKYGIDKAIESSLYPESKAINKYASIICFIALKLSSIKRYSHDDKWCMDRGLGLLAGLNVLPKSAWLSSYSSRVTNKMNISFLKSLHAIWVKNNLLSDTSNLDFTTIPYWGDAQQFENNWSGKRNKALSSMLAVLAQDPDNGIIDYGTCDVMHKNEANVVLEYLDFYNKSGNGNLKYLVFDSKFTNYENLSKLDDKEIIFLTIRRRGKKIIEEVLAGKSFKKITVEASGLKKRNLKVEDKIISLRGYYDFKTGEQKKIRQVAITGNGKIKPALIITNDFEIKTQEVVRKYARRWLVEKGISEQIEFFHLNRVSSSMVIKVDFDLTMTLVAHNLYRLLALELGRYSKFTAQKIFNKFIDNNGNIKITEKEITIELKKKRDLPQILELLEKYQNNNYPYLNNLKLNFKLAATS